MKTEVCSKTAPVYKQSSAQLEHPELNGTIIHEQSTSPVHKHHMPFICPVHPAVDPVDCQSFWRVQTIRD